MDVPELILGSWKVDGHLLITFEKNNISKIHIGGHKRQGFYSLVHQEDSPMWKLTAIEIGLYISLIKSINSKEMIVYNSLQPGSMMELDLSGNLISGGDIIHFIKHI